MTAAIAARVHHQEAMLRLRELDAPQGWTAAVLETDFPVSSHAQRNYELVVAHLLVQLPALERAVSSEVLLQFDRCDPDREIPIIQANAQSWQPEIGLGVWLDRDPPSLWSKEEFLAAAPGTLRPLLYRVFRIQNDPETQATAWRRMLGSGVLIRVALAESKVFLEDTTEYLQPRITEPSLSSFPFYFPLLTKAGIEAQHGIYDGGIEAWLPGADGYLRESAEDGGLLILVRQRPEVFWQTFQDSQLELEAIRVTGPDKD